MQKKLYEPKDTPMAVAVFMSGSGTNAVKLLEHQLRFEATGTAPYKVLLIVTDNAAIDNNAWNIARRFGLQEPIYSDFGQFRRDRIKDPGNMAEREPYFRDLARRIREALPRIDGIAFAGYELIVTEPLLSEFDGRIINVHPANLTLRGADGKPSFTGNHAVRAAILAGEREIRASTHVVVSGVDLGPVLLVSQPVKVVLPDGVTAADLNDPRKLGLANAIAKEHQNELKRVGDWSILPLTLELLARGAFGRDEKSRLCLNGEPIPNGAMFEAANKAGHRLRWSSLRESVQAASV